MYKFNIATAKTAGFCFGVDRAVKMVCQELEHGKVFTYGPIIHNPNVVNDLRKMGADVIASLDEVRAGQKIIIRSHGVGKAVYDKIERRGGICIDATCPFVARIHRIVSEKSENGYAVLIAGDKTHPEVQGILGHCSEEAFVFADEDDLSDIFKKI